MSAMKREKQYDMFDVATGACDLDHYLNQRYSENDLQSKFWIEKNDEMDELRPPPPGSSTTEPVLIPIQGPRAPKAAPKEPESTDQAGVVPEKAPEPEEGSAAAGSRASVSAPAPGPVETREAPSWESRQASPGQAPSLESFQGSTSVEGGSGAGSGTGGAPAQKAPSMEELLAQFHQAAKAYQERAEKEQEPGAPPEA